MMLVVVDLLDCLSLLQAMAHVGEELIALLHVPGNSGNPSLARLVRTDGRRVAAVHHAEWCLPK
jgi:hypothetical protein